jgi:hypothetical protein
LETGSVNLPLWGGLVLGAWLAQRVLLRTVQA